MGDDLAQLFFGQFIEIETKTGSAMCLKLTMLGRLPAQIAMKCLRHRDVDGIIHGGIRLGRFKGIVRIREYDEEAGHLLTAAVNLHRLV